MTSIVIEGWVPGVRTIALTQYIRDLRGGTLAEAKRQVEAMLGGGVLAIELADDARVPDVLLNLRSLGVLACIRSR